MQFIGSQSHTRGHHDIVGQILYWSAEIVAYAEAAGLSVGVTCA